MINKEIMPTLRKMTESLNKLNPEGKDAIIFFASSEESGSVTTLIKGDGTAVLISMLSLLDDVFEDLASDDKKVLKIFLIQHILQQ